MLLYILCIPWVYEIFEIIFFAQESPVKVNKWLLIQFLTLVCFFCILKHFISFFLTIFLNSPARSKYLSNQCNKLGCIKFFRFHFIYKLKYIFNIILNFYYPFILTPLNLSQNRSRQRERTLRCKRPTDPRFSIAREESNSDAARSRFSRLTTAQTH